MLGAGPSGCTAARLLAMWGHTVTLVTKPEAQLGAPLAESLTPSCGKFFDLLGIHTAIDDAGFVRTTGNTVWWGRVMRGWRCSRTAPPDGRRRRRRSNG